MKNKRGWIRVVEAKKNPLVLFESPQSSEGWHLLNALDGYHELQQKIQNEK